jgi:hypothetical protein
MNTSQPQGWTISDYKKFKVRDESSESESLGDTDEDDEEDEDEDEDDKLHNKMKGYHKKKYKKIAYLEELLPE